MNLSQNHEIFAFFFWWRKYSHLCDWKKSHKYSHLCNTCILLFLLFSKLYEFAFLFTAQVSADDSSFFFSVATDAKNKITSKFVGQWLKFDYG